MNVIYSNHTLPPASCPDYSIFLAGPTPRDKTQVVSWRPKAIQILEKLDFQGKVYVPERSDGSPRPSYEHQFEWELNALMMAGVIAFWVPRSLPYMPAFTTNVEFGKFVGTKPAVYGRPSEAPHCRYLDQLFKKYDRGNHPIYTTPENTITAAVEFLNVFATPENIGNI
jgi:hypothetical protein